MNEQYYTTMDCEGRTMREVYEQVQVIIRNPCGEIYLTNPIVIGHVGDNIKPTKYMKNFKFK